MYEVFSLKTFCYSAVPQFSILWCFNIACDLWFYFSFFHQSLLVGCIVHHFNCRPAAKVSKKPADKPKLSSEKESIKPTQNATVPREAHVVTNTSRYYQDTVDLCNILTMYSLAKEACVGRAKWLRSAGAHVVMSTRSDFLYGTQAKHKNLSMKPFWTNSLPAEENEFG